MYECSVCQSPVSVDHVSPPVKGCGCDGTIYASLKGAAHGSGRLEAEAAHHDLSPEGELLTKSFLIMLAGREFFANGKSSVRVSEQRMTDEATGRTIMFDIVERAA